MQTKCLIASIYKTLGKDAVKVNYDGLQSSHRDRERAKKREQTETEEPKFTFGNTGLMLE